MRITPWSWWILPLIWVLNLFPGQISAQTLPDSLPPASDSLLVDSVDSLRNDSLNLVRIEEFQQKLEQAEAQRVKDSLARAKLEAKLAKLKTTDNLKKEEILSRLNEIRERELGRKALLSQRIDSLRSHIQGFPVLGPGGDTLFLVYSHLGPFSARDRAHAASRKIRQIYKSDDDFLADSLRIENSDSYFTVRYFESMLISVSELDGIWSQIAPDSLANDYAGRIARSIVQARTDNSFQAWARRIALALLLVVGVLLLLWGGRRIYFWAREKVRTKLRHRFKDTVYQNYTFLSALQKVRLVLAALRVGRWLLVILTLYLSLPLLFSIFPLTKSWAEKLFSLVWEPFKSLLLAVWNYLPNLFTILVIILVMRYCLRLVRYFFREIQAGKLRINSFHRDWAMPTYQIVRFLLYAFMFVLIFPYLPGSDSGIFQGVSVFLGLLVSLGSSSAIANIVAGLVITYMRPFRIGDMVRIGEVMGVVVEKSMLVIRVRTTKNEEITVPNSSVLNSNTINYNSLSHDQGLILYTTVTIGYDVPWPLVHKALVEAALLSPGVEPKPEPFVLQTSLDDYYVAYQLNVYTHNAAAQPRTYSHIHANIQEVFAKYGIEIMSPHYRAVRDGSEVTIPRDGFNDAPMPGSPAEGDENPPAPKGAAPA